MAELPRLNGVIGALEKGRHALTTFTPADTEAAVALATAKYDAVVYEMEHNAYDIRAFRDCLQYMLNRRQIAQSGSLAPAVAPFARIPPNGGEKAQFHAKQVLDLGAGENREFLWFNQNTGGDILGKPLVAPASAAHSILRMCTRFRGVSRVHSTSGRRSLRQTSAARSIKLPASPCAILARVPMLHGITIIASVRYDPLATLAPISSLFCAAIFFDFAPTSCCTRLLRPVMPSSSAITRSALSEAMKFTVSTRSSRSRDNSSARVNIAPLAPVAATVSTWAVGCT